MPNGQPREYQDFRQRTYWIGLDGTKLEVESMTLEEVMRAIHTLWVTANRNPKMAWVFTSKLFAGLAYRGRQIIGEPN